MIDITKTYSTRNGIPVRILCTDGPDTHLPVIGVIGGNTNVSYWSFLGSFTDRLCPDDLIEVKPKIVVEKWVNVIKSSRGNIQIDTHSSQINALAETYHSSVQVLARAVPFVWREP